MSTIHIRAATRKDLPAIEEIEKSCFPADRRTRPRALRHSFKSPIQSVWLAVSGQEAAGAMVLWHYPRTLRIFSIAVQPAFRGSGTGQRMMEKAFALAKKAGCTAVTLEADKSNRVLTGWYEKFGFEIKQTLRDYYSLGHHAVRMRLELKPALEGGRARGRS